LRYLYFTTFIFEFQKRQEEISKFRKQKIDRKGILALLLSSDIEYEPFDMKEVAFNVIGHFCQNDPMSVNSF
jgi:hypothetical protein